MRTVFRSAIIQYASSIYKAVKGKSKRRREIAIDTAYEILLENENLRTEVCKMLKKCYPSQTDYTIKTFWYVFLDKLRKDGSYNHKVAIRMFCQNKGVGGIKITQCTEADVAVFLQEMIDEGESESYIKAVLRNLNCLYHILGSEYENPCAGALAEVTQSIQKHREFRDGSIRRSFDMIEAKTLYRLFKADINTAAAGLARGGLISMFTPMGETEVCALCGENIDYIKSIDLFQFKTTHTSDYFSTERTELLCLDEQRVIPVSRILRNELMLDSKPFDSRKPIVCDSDGLAVTPKQLRMYISEKIKQVKIQKLVIDLPGKGLVDLNDYRGNWLRSNLDYALRNHSKISPEDLNYVMGRKFSTTDAGHYRDYRCSLRQIAISTSINRWADKFDENDFESSNTKSYIVNSGNRVREFYRDPDPYMIITDISIPQAECGMNLEFQSVMRFGGVVIVEEID